MFLPIDAALASGTQKVLLRTFCPGPGDLWVFPDTTVFCIEFQDSLYVHEPTALLSSFLATSCSDPCCKRAPLHHSTSV